MLRNRAVVVVLFVALALSACSGDSASPLPTAPIGDDAALADLESLLANWNEAQRVDVDITITRQFPEPEAEVDPIIDIEHRFRWDDTGPAGIGRTQLTAEPVVASIDYRIVDDTVWRLGRPNAMPEWQGEPLAEHLDAAPFDARTVLQGMIEASSEVRSVERRANGGSVWDLTADGASLAAVALPPAEGDSLIADAPAIDVLLRIEIDAFGRPLSARSDMDEWWTFAVQVLEPELDRDGALQMQLNALFDVGGEPLDVETPCVDALTCAFEG